MQINHSKKILVTGGAGYIGSELVRNLLSEGFQVVAFDNLTFGGESLLGFWNNPNFSLYKGDLLNTGDVTDALRDVDYVCHLAAIVGEPPCKKYPELARKVNWEASVKLYQLCKEAAIERFVFASTCSNYGKMAESDAYLDETTALNPISLYSETKVEFENYLFGQNDGICKTILRFSTVYGVSPRIRFDLTVNEFTRDAALERPLLIYGEHFWRPYCHVSDLANSVKLVLISDKFKIDNQAFNVGDTSQNYTKKMLMEEILKLLPDMKVSYHSLVSDPRDYKVNCDKIKNILGFEITKNIPQGIREIADLVKGKIITDPYNSRYCNV